MSELSGPSWNLSEEYTGFADPTYSEDWQQAESYLGQVSKIGASLSSLKGEERFKQLAEAVHSDQQAALLAGDLFTYCNCLLSVNSDDNQALAEQQKLMAFLSRLSQEMVSIQQAVLELDDSGFAAWLQQPLLEPYGFLLKRERLLKVYQLPEREESLVASLEQPGHQNWGTLYSQLTSILTFPVEDEKGKSREIGMAEVANILRGCNESARKQAFLAQEKGLEKHSSVFALNLNSIAQWRCNLYSKRSENKNLHYLDPALHQSRIQAATLEAMLAVCQENKAKLQQLVLQQAKLMGKKTLDPWDSLAGCPGDNTRSYPYAEAIELIKEAFAVIDPEVADFVDVMASRGWVEAGISGKRRPGAYCTGFRKSRTPRVYMTYDGSMANVSTLAHELGHAYHNWVMRDMPVAKTRYPMTLAETASILSQHVLNEALGQKLTDPESRREIWWSEAQDAIGLCLNIPARYTYENQVYKAMSAGETLGAEQHKAFCLDAFQQYFGETYSRFDPYFWASKLHFYIIGVKFYNFPYLFGYLFSLGVLATRKSNPDFIDTYKNLLRDTGTMVAEDVAQKHLGADLTQTDFWQSAFDLAMEKIEGLRC